MLFFLLGRKYKIFKFISLGILMIIAVRIFLTIICSNYILLSFTEVSSIKIKNKNILKLGLLVNNTSALVFYFNGMEIKSQSIESKECKSDPLLKKNFDPLKIEENQSKNVVFYYLIKKTKDNRKHPNESETLKESQAIFIFSKYFFTIKLPTKIDLNSLKKL